MEVYQIQVSLKNFTPKIWRRILVNSDVFLSDFHLILQTTMGWHNGHPHQFEKGRVYYSPPNDYDLDTVDYSDILLKDLLINEKDKITYTYDFGDSWDHQILLEKILTEDKKTNYPVCIKGKMNCPPEDCGGVWGYADLLEALNDPKHPEHDEFAEWLGGDFEPSKFDIEEKNELLQRI